MWVRLCTVKYLPIVLGPQLMNLHILVVHAASTQEQGHNCTTCHQPHSYDTLIASHPPISLSLIVGRSKCDAEASVTRRIFYFLCLDNTSLQPHIPISDRLQTINITAFLVIELRYMHEESESDSLAKSS